MKYDWKATEEKFAEEVGKEAPDLFRRRDASSTIYDQHPVSPTRFVTVEVAPYLLERFGVEAPVSVCVWLNRKLHELARVDVDILLYSYRNRNTYHVERYGGQVQFVDFLNGSVYLGTYHPYEDELFDLCAATITEWEFDYIAEKLLPVENYTGPVEEEVE